MDPGKRDSLIAFERPTTTTNDYGEEIEGTPTTVQQAWARVRFGTGQERREAAQERADQAATFECDWSETLAGITTTDRIRFDADVWDITSRAPLGHREIHFTAIRAA